MTINEILGRIPNVTKSGKSWSAQCPAHEDRRASLSISEGEDGRTLLCCHAGCTLESILTSLALTKTDLFRLKGPSKGRPARSDKPANKGKSAAIGKPKRNGKAQIVATYDYCDETGNVLFQVVRYEPKDFRQRRPKSGGGWDWSVKGLRVVLYRLPQLLAEPTRPVIVVEGEKDVDNLAKIGLVATCNAGGAGKWSAEHAEFLRGRPVIVLADNDDPGRSHAQQVSASLNGIAKWTLIVELPNLPPKGDVSDWLASGGTKDELSRVIKTAIAQIRASSTPAVKPWPEINSFDGVDEVPEFPTHVLPLVLRNWVEEESHATQTPPVLAGLLALAVCSATIARRVVIEPRQGWREPVNLFVAVLLDPGNRKSAVFGDAINPLKERETELIELARPAVARSQSERRQSETRLRKMEKIAGEKGDASARHEAGELSATLAQQPERVLPQLIVDDSTSEKLGMMLADQGGRIASMSPEGGVFDLMKGLYSKSGIPQFGVYLMGHSGDDLITDRVSRKSVRVERPALTCAFAMQPAVIEGLAENAAFRGRGLLARFLYAAPQSWIGRREIAPTPVSDTTREAYRQMVRALAEAVVDGEFVLHLVDDAAAMLYEWEAEIEAMLDEGGQMELMRDWGAKLAGATLRLAAVLHCVEHGPAGRIEKLTLSAAVEIARYLVPQAEAVLKMMSAKEASGNNDALYVLRWIERHRRREFTKSEAQHHGKRQFPKAEDIDPALDELTRRGFIRPKSVGANGPGRPPSPTFEVNPAAFADAKPEKRSHNSHNSLGETGSGNSGNNGSALEQSETTNRVRVTI